MFFVFFFVLMIVKISTIYPTIIFGWTVINIAFDFALIKMYFEVSKENPGDVERSTDEESLTF